MSLPIEGWTSMVAAKDELSTRQKASNNPPTSFDQSANVSSRVPPNLETISSKEEMKNAGGGRPDPYQLGYFLLGRPSPTCAGQPSMMRSVQAY